MATPFPPRLPVVERVRRAGIVAWSIIGLLILSAVGVWVLFKVRIIFPPLVLALLIIYLLNPLVSRLEQRGVTRSVGAILSYVVVLGGVTLVVAVLIPPIARQIESFSAEWPEFRLELLNVSQDLAVTLEDRAGVRIDTTRIACLLDVQEDPSVDIPSDRRCDEVDEEFRETITEHAGRLTEIGSSVLEAILIFILAPLLALYLLIDLPQLQHDMLNVFPETHREEVADLGSKIGRTVGGFFRGQFLVAIVVGVMSSLGFALIGLPFWLVIGAIAGLTNLIPLVGPFIGGGLGFLIGTVSGGVGLGLRAILVALVVQQVDNHIISPNIMKRTVQLHPATVMLSILAGATLAGFWGVLLGVPFVAVGKLLLGHLWATRILGVEVSPFGHPDVSSTPPSVVPADDLDEDDSG
ncbi:MAG TPA: AI-2E family transporter [Actinomycetota bacterium]|nr:AI-2E family transporter [Actinomycetota bacterium]